MRTVILNGLPYIIFLRDGVQMMGKLNDGWSVSEIHELIEGELACV